jgi:hypothetical protein
VQDFLSNSNESRSTKVAFTNVRQFIAFASQGPLAAAWMVLSATNLKQFGGAKAAPAAGALSGP